jgi:hypothetical protein
MLWKEERNLDDPLAQSEDQLKGVGASPGPGGDFDGGDEEFDADDLEGGEDFDGSESPISGAENADTDTDTDENA